MGKSSTEAIAGHTYVAKGNKYPISITAVHKPAVIPQKAIFIAFVFFIGALLTGTLTVCRTE